MIYTPSPLPTISCLLVTAGGRFDYFKQSYKCYRDQTYPYKELVVVNEGPIDYQNAIKEHIGDAKDVRYVFLKGKYSLGALRNISIGLSTGELFCQWDDDDFNMPSRLYSQYLWLSKHRHSRVCYFSDQLHYYFNLKRLYWEDWLQFGSGNVLQYSLIPGTIMAYKSDFQFTYPSIGGIASAGEDTVLANKVILRGQTILYSGSGHMNVYSYHGKNVWDIDHHLQISQHRSHSVPFLLKNRDKICETLAYLKFEPPIQVMGRDGLAFIYDN